jgi:membrane associated rhomboid family serine protease
MVLRRLISNNRVTLVVSSIYLALFVANLCIGNDLVFNALSGSGFHKLDGQLYRILTASFLHANWIHLSANILALFCVGSFLENRLGHLSFLALYFLSDVFASVLFYGYFNECSNGNGSSVALYAMFAVLSVLWLRYPHAFADKKSYPALIYMIFYFILASFSGNETTIILHSFSFFVGLALCLFGIQLKLIHIKDEKPSESGCA